MSDIAIRVEGLGKQYHIGGAQVVHDRLGEQVVDMLKAPLRRAGKLLRGQATGAAELDETIWALREVSCEIRHGEVVGIIGRNGAGKSTFLKILSKITEPTEGFAEVRGRVGSLLEVGTGFHPELTGRENVYLNGAILGMQRNEIARKFDEIVAFAEIDKFIDTPVKHYSSGMYVRLAFSVAAHLEPEILLVDEVLAVGDIAFQKKCLGKMDDVAQEGRTVLFVSHNMAIMQSLCQRGILLDGGTVETEGPITQVVDTYLTGLENQASMDLSRRTDRRGAGAVRLVKMEADNGIAEGPGLKAGMPARFVFHIDKILPGMQCALSIYDGAGQPVTYFHSKVHGAADIVGTDGSAKFVCEVDNLYLAPDRYRLDVAIDGDGTLQDYVQSAMVISVQEGNIDGRPTVVLPKYRKFKVQIPHRWTLPATT